MSTRREFLSSIPAIWASAPVVVKSAPAYPESIAEKVDDLVTALDVERGGNWSCRQTPNFVLFQRDD